MKFYVYLLPAPAGMIPKCSNRVTRIKPSPRTRGDDPGMPAPGGGLSNFSPHPRG